MLFRNGCRKGNSEAIISGRKKLSTLFYTRHHPRYQRIMALIEYVESLMPEDVRKNVHSSYTMNRTGNVGHKEEMPAWRSIRMRRDGSNK